jgi:RNA polymerase sigma factor (sigma-70 family)
MNEHESESEPRRQYEEALVRAMHIAERFLPRDEALEIAHSIACEMLRLPAGHVTGALIYIAVTRRIRSHWRSTARRAAIEGAYHEAWSAATHAWSEPGSSLEIGELHDRIAQVLASMPRRMREVFILIREEELSYKEAAARLGVSVSTIHTQISRASALLRACLAEYRAEANRANPIAKERVP